MKFLKYALAWFFIFGFLANTNLANSYEYKAFNVNNIIQAYFPNKPNLMFEVGDTKNFQAEDEESKIAFALNITSGFQNLSKEKQKEVIEGAAKGALIPLSGKRKALDLLNGRNLIAYAHHFEYELNGLTVRKSEFICIHKGFLISWNVQSVVGISEINAKDIFMTYVNEIKLL
jgi:hypothetical protein